MIMTFPANTFRTLCLSAIASGIINTISSTGRTLSLSPRIETESMAACMAYESPQIRVLSSDLLSALYPDEDDPSAISMDNLQKVVYSLLSESPTLRLSRNDKERHVVLKILCQLLLWLEHDTFAKPA